MTNVPLKNASVDLAIFSLSLMNTDFSDALREANRILRSSGRLWIAEVECRFDAGKGGVDGFVRELAGLGFQLKGSVDRSHKVFVLMEFVKKGEAMARADGLSLKSCKYKKR
jgi:ubiquinone/menaquinone biosynthesis C-methylase UbiE